MDDRIEKYIKGHRDEMDVKIPRNDLWGDIEQQLESSSKQVRISKSVMYWKAAAVILLLITSWLAIDKLTSENRNIRQAEVAVVNPELMEAEGYYISLIDQKREEIINLGQKYELGKDFLKEIDQLDKMYAILKQDLKGGNEDNLVDAMILNLQLRVEVLSQQLRIIQSIEKSQKDETVNL